MVSQKFSSVRQVREVDAGKVGLSIPVIPVAVGPVSDPQKQKQPTGEIVVSWRISRDSNHAPGPHSRSCEPLLDEEFEQFR